ncbi:hypothetical protein GE21DRAFT_3839 [Neurospora crassa]|uniref:Uncharacterized protein n=1 Tax=Neurospora crassa (strain ATCC 24698 / 74-OR23-1A / CBS 708.71 / DSM 1257 / FGSC 987) TaxID=367110 RepID=Q7S336_NEUCR|nr:hypothetical protein NCU09179 [Neurospora crassa OR74A]EAA29853.1 hypothetical protein NCU09179 [Neurospora crassa OR74A]KHE84340.1 hypothetical protein GE21DRAFT_3839 [Neurospora crassa]|eukprot:XP_959089.1 hypothetical protein NCU09179 [Neurospora crassa OR74A]
MAWNNESMCWGPPMINPCRPAAQSRNIIEQINTAPDDTIRAILRYLTGDYDTRFMIETLLPKLPLDESEMRTHEDESSRKRKADTHTPEDQNPKKRKLEICLQCDEAFEEGDTSASCRYHTSIQFDPEAPYWQNKPPGIREDGSVGRTVHKPGYWFPCCHQWGTHDKLGCRLGPHRAADGVREKDLDGWKSYEAYQKAMGVPNKEDMLSWEAHCIDLRKQASMAAESDFDAEESDSASESDIEESDSTPATEQSDKSRGTPATQEPATSKTTQIPEVVITNGEGDDEEEGPSWVDECDKAGRNFPDITELPRKKRRALLRAQEIAFREAFPTREAYESHCGPLLNHQTLTAPVEVHTMVSYTSGLGSSDLKRQREESPGTERRKGKRTD